MWYKLGMDNVLPWIIFGLMSIPLLGLIWFTIEGVFLWLEERKHGDNLDDYY